MNTQHGISGWLVRHAAASAPPSLRERLEEEWLADLQARRGNMSRLMFGAGCCWAAQTIAREFPAGVMAASAANGNVTTAGIGIHPSQRWSQRPGAMTLIIAFHVVVIYAFTTVFQHIGPSAEPPVISGDFLLDPSEKSPPAPRPKPQFTEATVDPLPTNNHFSFPQETQSITLVKPAEPTGSGVVSEVIRVAGGPGAGFPSAEEYYPAPAKWLSEQGSASVRVCVDASGRLTETPVVAQSSGSPRLDAGAIRLALAGSGHYRPTKENGRPVSSCYAFRVTFRLQ